MNSFSRSDWFKDRHVTQAGLGTGLDVPGESWERERLGAAAGDAAGTQDSNLGVEKRRGESSECPGLLSCPVSPSVLLWSKGRFHTVSVTSAWKNPNGHTSRNSVLSIYRLKEIKSAYLMPCLRPASQT